MEDLDLLQVVSSSSRQRILDLLSKGVDHPEDIARRLKVRRQSVDKQLLELYGWGFVDRSAVFPADGRPRIVYHISERAKGLLAEVGTNLRVYEEGMLADYRQNLQFLEGRLAAGELDEGAYRKRRRALEARYEKFLNRRVESQE